MRTISLPQLRTRRDGGTLLVALTTITVLSIVAGSFVLSVTSRSQTAVRSGSWHEAGLAAEAGSDMAVAEIRRVLPKLMAPPADAWSGWTSSTSAFPTSPSFPAGMILTLDTPVLTHTGEGNTQIFARVTVDAPAGLVYPAGSGMQWLRVRSVGTALLPGRREPALSKMDTSLRHFAFYRERSDLVGRPSRAVTQPEVSRAVEVIVQPLPPFQQALLSVGAIGVTSSSALIDSYDSSDSAKSTSGLYDSNKRQQNGSAYTLGTSFAFAGSIYGDAGTDGGTLAKTSAISGNVNNSYYQALTPVPAIPSGLQILTPGSGNNGNGKGNGNGNKDNYSFAASTSATSPTRYQISSITSSLSVSGNSNQNTYAELYVSGDLSGNISIDPGVQLTIYAAGNVSLNAQDLVNKSYRAANLQIFGVQPGVNQNPSITLNLGTDLYATVYAPGHTMQITGTGDFMGALVAKSVTATSGLRLHYDESLLTTTGKIVGYQAASWIEDVR